MFNLKKIGLLRIVIILEVISFLFYTASISRDYQDGWILEGLELPYIIFVITTVTYFIIEKQFNWMILFAVIIRTTFLMVPNLKYFWFQGIEMDQHQQYRLALDTLNDGHIAQGELYSQTPLFSLSLTILSMFSGLSMLESTKFYPLMLWLTYPIWIYIISKKFNLSSSALKYVVLISSIPIKSSTSYLNTGTLFGSLFLFIILVQLSNLFINKNRNSLIILIILTFSLAFGHTVSSVILSTTLIIIFILPLIYNILSRNLEIKNVKPSSTIIIMLIAIIIACTSIAATRTFTESTIFLGDRIKLLLNIPISHKWKGFIPVRFGEIVLIDQMLILLTFYGADFLFMFLIAVSVIIFIKDHELVKKRGLIFLSLFNVALGIILFLGFLFNFGANWMDRVNRYIWMFAPVSIGMIFCHIERTHARKIYGKVLKMMVMGLLVSLATIELYRCQPLIPSADSLGKELPADIPSVTINQVNTAYQRYLIYHAIQYIPSDTRIAMDKGTANQLYGYSDSDFFEDRRKLLPFTREETTEPDYFLIHFPGISGKFDEIAEYRTKSFILSMIDNSIYNFVYSNAESYMLQSVR